MYCVLFFFAHTSQLRRILIFFSDHGQSLWDNRNGGKFTLFESDLRIPLLVAAPGLPAAAAQGRRSAALASLLDVVPTVLDMARPERSSLPPSPPPPSPSVPFDGESLASVFLQTRRRRHCDAPTPLRRRCDAAGGESAAAAARRVVVVVVVPLRVFPPRVRRRRGAA